MLLIITNKKDFTVDHVIKRLYSLKIPFLRFNTEDFPIKFKSTVALKSKDIFSIESLNKESNFKCSGSDITSIWYRRPLASDLSSTSLSLEDLNFAVRESQEYIQNMFALLEDKLWVNDPFSLRKAERKSYQLLLAQKLGFNVPDTIITNDSDEFKSFYDSHKGNIIAKPISNGSYGLNEEKVIFAIDLSTIENKLDIHFNDVIYSPLIIQEKIIKKFDVRTIVFGNEIFSYAIKSHSSYFDWRSEDSSNIYYEEIKTPTQVRDKIDSFMEITNLKFGAFDFSVNTNNEWFFLEINPNGQWAWIEYLVKNNKMTHSLITFLTKYDI